MYTGDKELFGALDSGASAFVGKDAPAPPPLSPREREVLELVVDGFAIRQIARRLFISESTAKTHVANIYQKLGVGNRAQAVVTAIRLELVRRPGSDGDGTRDS